MDEKNEIILYQPDDKVTLEVRLDNDTVWLTQAQMAELFETTPQNITIHIRNLYKEGELEVEPTCKDFLQVRVEGNRKVNRIQKIYNLDVIISVGYRVKSLRGTQFRQWANRVLKEYLLKGYSVNQRFERLEHRVADLGKKWFAFCKMQLQASEILQRL
ncbi:MAG: virulence RhuM family protein [Bacteroidales bacterium]|nr:virulence RhuM family protein [Bacteroidales bacterium]